MIGIIASGEEEMKFKIINQYHIYSFLLTCLIAIYFLNYGDLNSLFQVGNLTSAYDSLARNLLEFKLGVDPQYIKGEGFTREGTTYMYFGIMPAIMRIPLIALLPKTFGLWNGISRTIAYLLCLCFATKIAHHALENNQSLKTREKQILLFLSIIGFGLGSMFYQLMTFMSTFNEAIIWALAFSVIAIYQIIKYLNTENNIYLLGLAIFACFAFLTKVTFGITLLFILLFIFIKDLKKIGSFSIAILIPVILSLSLQAWVNQTRFGSVFTFCDYKIYDKWLQYKDSQPKIYKQRSSIEILKFSRVAKNSRCYLKIKKYNFKDRFPYFKPINTYFPKGPFHENYEEGSQVFPFPWVYSWLFVAFIFGSVAIFRRKQFSLEVIFLCFFLEAFSILCYKAINQRYLAEFMPLCCFCFYFYLVDFKNKGIAIPLKILLVIYSIIVTTAVALDWRARNPYSQQDRVKKKTRNFINKTNNQIKKFLKKSNSIKV
jgi:hypothetical protein